VSKALEFAAKLRKQAEANRSPILGHLHVEDLFLLEVADELERLERASQPVWTAVVD
jgi:hypothetical protein